ncbi:hypothetical protein BH10ACT8_BH10ACT8_00660 [soil metagenome]
MSALSEKLVAANSAGLSARAISRKAREAGYHLHHDTVARYLGGSHGRPDESTLTALAAVLGVGLADLRRAADLPSDEVEPYLPPAEASRLTRRQRRAVDELIRAMVQPPRTAAGPQRHEPGDVVRLEDHGQTGASRRAARRGEVEPEQD